MGDLGETLSGYARLMVFGPEKEIVRISSSGGYQGHSSSAQEPPGLHPTSLESHVDLGAELGPSYKTHILALKVVASATCSFFLNCCSKIGK